MSNFAFFFLNKDMLTLAKYVNEFEGGPNDQNDIYQAFLLNLLLTKLFYQTVFWAAYNLALSPFP